jgi:two-component system, cell cycle response regulator DivK
MLNPATRFFPARKLLRFVRMTPEPLSQDTRSRPVVLVVDDDLDARLIYRHYLTVMGCCVYTARDGLIGVEMAKRRKPDVIVMDLAMPRLDGWAATAELKDSPLTRSIPIIVLSAVSTSRSEARAAGCDGFLAKPCLPELLWCEIRLLLNADSTGELH